MSTRLVLVRHGDAVTPPGRGYDAATLSARGTEEARAVGTIVRRIIGHVDAILTSPLPRARETADVIAATLDHGPAPISAHEMTSGAFRGDWLDALEIYAPDAAVIIGVGHAPEVGAIAAELGCGGGANPLAFTTGTAACVELGPTHGRLMWFLPARAIAALERHPAE